ncbi:MAG TPA: alpha/beta fold hydrolase [Acidimicrobiales bacterium]|nr:alpha/beta fold hydrolase [Acidimicrobiales bacterium]
MPSAPRGRSWRLPPSSLWPADVPPWPRRPPRRSGDVSYLSTGDGPDALFVHGVFLNADLWRRLLAGLADLRPCLAVDLLAHGESSFPTDGCLSMDRQAEMIIAFLDALDLDAVDLVGNDSGGAIAQLVAVRVPQRIRTLTLTNGDTHGNWPPTAFAPIHQLARAGARADSLAAPALDPATARACRPPVSRIPTPCPTRPSPDSSAPSPPRRPGPRRSRAPWPGWTTA